MLLMNFKLNHTIVRETKYFLLYYRFCGKRRAILARNFFTHFANHEYVPEVSKLRNSLITD